MKFENVVRNCLILPKAVNEIHGHFSEYALNFEIHDNKHQSEFLVKWEYFGKFIFQMYLDMLRVSFCLW